MWKYIWRRNEEAWDPIDDDELWPNSPAGAYVVVEKLHTDLPHACIIVWLLHSFHWK